MAQVWLKFRGRLVTFGTTPLISGAAAVMSVLAGALASFFTGAIRASLGLSPQPGASSGFALANFAFTFEAAIFWTLVFSAAGLFAFSRFADTATENEHRTLLNKSLASLESMPPEAFLAKLALLYAKAAQVVGREQYLAQRTRGTTTEEKFKTTLRLVLETLGDAASAYDGGVDAQYRVSVLLFTTRWPVDLLEMIVDTRSLNPDAHRGALVTQPDMQLLKTVGDSHRETDELLASPIEYALPVYETSGSEHVDGVLPGAAVAFSEGTVVEYGRIDEMLANLEETLPDRRQIPRLTKFYATGAGKGVRSFVAFPLPNPRWRRTDIELAGADSIGVLVIESSIQHSVRAAEAFFWPVVQPFLYLLSDLFALRPAVSSTDSGVLATSSTETPDNRGIRGRTAA